MNRDELKRMYGTTPEGFSLRIHQALQAKEEPRRSPAPRLRMALAVGLGVLLLCAAALAVFHSQVAEIFGRSNETLKQDLLEGRIAQTGETLTFANVTFTLEEVTYIQDGLYAVGRITPADGANVLLMSRDQEHTPQDAIGTDHYIGAVPEGPTYGEKAAETGARMLLPDIVPEGVGVEDGPVLPVGSVGLSQHPQADGSLLFTLQIPTGTAVTPGESYTLELWVSCCEYGLEDGTYQGRTWTVSVTPQPAKED